VKTTLRRTIALVCASLVALAGTHTASAAGKNELVSVTMTVTASVPSDKRQPAISTEDVLVKRGKELLQVTGWTPAQASRAGLDLFILIDEASDPVLGSHLDELRAFVNAQPPTTSVGIGYMRNATVQIAQNFTTDHARAANAIRLPLGTPGAYGSPYLSVIDLMNRWPQSQNRREVLMITDGIDRAHRGFGRRGIDIVPDVDSAARVAQRTGTMIHSIYAPGADRLHRNYWQASNGQLAIAKLSDATGGESFFLGLQNAVSFQPYLNELQRALDNQYLLTFLAKSNDKAGLQYISVDTNVAGVEFGAPDAVWIPATGK
jgi:hypothetical protein